MTAPVVNEWPLEVVWALSDAPKRFAGHFARQVVIPGAALLDRIVLEFEAAAGVSITSVKQAKFVTAALPQEPLTLSGSIAGTTARFELRREQEIVCSGVLMVGASG